MNKKIILASQSPRRKELLEKCGISFDVMVTDADETVNEKMKPSDFVSLISKRKAEQAVDKYISENSKHSNVIIISADTIVALGDEIFGKPKDNNDAFSMLKKLQGKSHFVYTSLTVAYLDNKIDYKEDICGTEVKFKPLSDTEILDYIATGEPMDKAGAYAIQGIASKFIEKINGDYNNVVGLSTDRLIRIIKD
jgi:septum formation protein